MTILRRLVAILLLTVFVLPLVSASLALGQDPEPGLPSCCRRTGEHHCAMSMAERSQMARVAPAPAWKSPAMRCPFCPVSPTTGVHADALWLRAETATSFGVRVAAPSVRAAECSHRLARERARHKRGPPSFLLN